MYCESGSKYELRLFQKQQFVMFLHIIDDFNSIVFYLTGYTLFALFEYLVVISNMAFHLTAVWDFRSRDIMVISSSEDKNFWLKTPVFILLCFYVLSHDCDAWVLLQSLVLFFPYF